MGSGRDIKRLKSIEKCYIYTVNTVGVKKKFPFTIRTAGTGNPVPFPFNFHPVAVQSPFVFNPFYGQPARSINQVNGLGSARNLKRASY